MAKTTPDDRALLRAYLLGQLEPDAADRVEDRFAADAAYFDMYLEVERELVGEYAAGQMESGAAESFRRCYLVTAERRRQVAIVRAIDEVQTERQSVPAATYYRTGWLVSSLAAAALVVIALYWNHKRTDGRDAPGASQAASASPKATDGYSDVARVPAASPPFGPVPPGASGDSGEQANSRMTATDFAALLHDRPEAPDIAAPLAFAGGGLNDNTATPSLRTLREGAEALHALYGKFDEAGIAGIATLVGPQRCDIQRVYELIDRANGALGLWLKAELSYWDAVADEESRTPANPESARRTQAAFDAEMTALKQSKEAIGAYGIAMQSFYAKIRGAASQVCGSAASSRTALPPVAPSGKDRDSR